MQWNKTGIHLLGLMTLAAVGCVGNGGGGQDLTLDLLRDTVETISVSPNPTIIYAADRALADEKRDVPIVQVDGGEERQVGMAKGVAVGAAAARELFRHIQFSAASVGGQDLVVRATPRLRHISARLHGPPEAPRAKATVSVVLALVFEDEDGAELLAIEGRGEATSSSGRMMLADLVLFPVDMAMNGRAMEKPLIRLVVRDATEKAARQIATELNTWSPEAILVADSRGLPVAGVMERAAFFNRRGSHERAELYLHTAKLRDPGNLAVMLVEGEWLARGGNHAAARAAFERALRRAEDSIEGQIAAQWLHRMEHPITVHVFAISPGVGVAADQGSYAAARLRVALQERGNVRVATSGFNGVASLEEALALTRDTHCDSLVGVEVFHEGGFLRVRARVVGVQSGRTHLTREESMPWSGSAGAVQKALDGITMSLAASLGRELI